MLEVAGLRVDYGAAPALSDVSLAMRQGALACVVGPNGAGKSTLLNTIMGLVPCGGGAIRFDGKALTRQPTPAIVQAGLVQVPERRQLFGAMTVEENLLMGAYTRRDRGGIQAALEEQFARFPILAERRRQRAETFSGGQQQMLAIARALMSQPRLLLLDEPSLGLAPLVAQQILREIVTLRDAGGTVFVVEQNARAALAIADRGYVLENGRITLSGRAADLLGDTAVQDAYLGGAGGANEVEDHIRERKRAILGR
jgi:branched-chain amino acid transport system ATP-binding protein